MISPPRPNPSRENTPWAHVPEAQWADWAWQFRNRIDDIEAARGCFSLSAEEQKALVQTRPKFRFGITPYYALLANRTDPDCPMRRQMIPRPDEARVSPGELRDPLGEEPREVVPHLVHRYPDRVLLLVTDRCPVYCRFCTRRRVVGSRERQAPRAELRAALDYVRARPRIREVILSGGDALMVGDRTLGEVLQSIRTIDHVDIVRIATRMPVTCPMRITDALVERLAPWAPIYVMTHFNHPAELTASAAAALAKLVDAGIVVYNQSVLLRGVNDDEAVIRELNRGLVKLRATPYYLHQCDVAEGIEHFRTSLSKGLEIVDRLRGHTSGLMVPQLCVDVPGGLGKVTVLPEWIVERSATHTRFRTYTGEVADYPEPTR
jgi:lysine 2,3-aminomutase